MYISNKNGRMLTNSQDADKINNQIIMTGTDEYFLIGDGTFFLTTFHVVAGQTITVVDGQGNDVISVTGDHTYRDKDPMRLDYGIIISGTVGYAKGYYRRGIIA